MKALYLIIFILISSSVHSADSENLIIKKFLVTTQNPDEVAKVKLDKMFDLVMGPSSYLEHGATGKTFLLGPNVSHLYQIAATDVGGNTESNVGILGKSSYFLVENVSGMRGVAQTELSFLSVDPNFNVRQTALYGYKWDMESGLCGRESLNLETASDLLKLGTIKRGHNWWLVLSFKEQNCETEVIADVERQYSFNVLRYR